MKAAFLLFGKGILIGGANLAPGLSGSALAASMGVYETFVSSLTALVKRPKQAAGILLPLGGGILTGGVSCAFFLERLYLRWPAAMNGLFLLLALVCIPGILKEVKGEGGRALGSAVCAACFLAAFLSGIWKPEERAAAVLSAEVGSLLKLFLIGNASAAALIVPGISGTLLLTAWGFYMPLLQLLNRTASALLTADFLWLWEVRWQLFSLGCGLLLGGYGVAEGMGFLLKKHRRITYWGILGVVLAAPCLIIWKGI